MAESCAIESNETDRGGWKFLVWGISLFSIIALYELTDYTRPIFLTAGTLSIYIIAIFIYISFIKTQKISSILGLFIILYWSILFPASINGIDDNAAYLIFARDFYYSLDDSLQILSERRIFSVGGLYSFQGTILAWIGLRGMSLVEPVLGLLTIFVIILNRIRDTDRVVAVLLVGAVGMAPLAGSLVIANTASAFTLSAFTLALLELSKDATAGKTNRRDIFLMVLALCAAALFRPTT
jgi:hypothetical protein